MTGKRDLSPVHVRYVRYPSMDIPRAGLKFDGAYWVDGLVIRDSSAVDSHGEIDATTDAVGGNQPKLVQETPSVSAAQGGLSPATVTGQHYEAGDPIQERNAFTAKLSNLSAITFISDRMGLDTRSRATAKVTGDGPTTIKLTGRWPRGIDAELDGTAVKVKRRKRWISLTVDLGAQGAHELTIG